MRESERERSRDRGSVIRKEREIDREIVSLLYLFSFFKIFYFLILLYKKSFS